jgi:ArsR family transcriptional regulator
MLRCRIWIDIHRYMVPSGGAMPTPVATVAPAACCAPLATPSLSPADAEATAALFRALADPHRVQVVNLLATRAEPVCVCDLTDALGVSQPTTSHHLKKLVQAGLLEREQRGTWAYYRLNHDAMARLAAVVDLQGGLP